MPIESAFDFEGISVCTGCLHYVKHAYNKQFCTLSSIRASPLGPTLLLPYPLVFGPF